ncbi:MAG: hypothetical protein MI922_21715 [Bacteroidales bacterium]|nr:hypothetical protein [Bacteroidales bacterium]
MKKKIFFGGALMVAIGASFLFSSCEKEEILPVEPDGAATKYIPSNFQVYNITESGTYIIKGTVTGQYIHVKAPDVTIKGEGSNPTFKGKGYGGQARSASHIRGGGQSLTIKDFTFIGRVKHNFISVNSKNTHIEGLTVYNNTKQGAGAINPGAHSMVTKCHIEPHDDAIKITEPDSKAKDNYVKMDGNGSVIQFGWGARSDGAIHYADDIRIEGFLKRNKQTNTNDNPGRAVIGGIFEKPKPGEQNASDIKLTNLDINMSSQHDGHYVKLRATGKLTDVYIQGVIRNQVKVHSTIKPIALSTGGGGEIRNITIDFGNKINMSHVHKDGGVKNLTIGGGTNPCAGDPAPTGSILQADVNTSGDAVVLVEASDNKGVTLVELHKGTQKLASLTAPNSGDDYEFTTADLASGDDFTVKIFDGCDKVKNLTGTIGSSDPCAGDPAPTGSVLQADVNNAGDAVVVIEAADNKGVTKVELLKGTQLVATLVAPNAGTNYKFTTAQLAAGDAFTVNIVDGCDNVTSLTGTITGNDPCANDPAPKGTIVTAKFNKKNKSGKVVIQASDNKKVVKVEVFKGSSSMGSLKAPNTKSGNYRIVNKALKKGNAFTVVITDDCGKTTTLSGKIS